MDNDIKLDKSISLILVRSLNIYEQLVIEELNKYSEEEVLGIYRMGRTGSVSHNKFEQAKYHWQLYRKIEKHNIIRSTCELICWAFVKGTGIGLNKRKD